jgi:Peptidase inhibitor family I36
MRSSFTTTAHPVRIRSARLAAVFCAGLLGVTLAPRPASTEPTREGAAPPRATAKGPPPCNAHEICLFEKNDYQGTPWRWSPPSGYSDVPPYLHDNVGSFIANAAGCFIDWKKPPPHGDATMRKVAIGDYSAAFKHGDKFGSRLDAVKEYQHCP